MFATRGDKTDKKTTNTCSIKIFSDKNHFSDQKQITNWLGTFAQCSSKNATKTKIIKYKQIDNKKQQQHKCLSLFIGNISTNHYLFLKLDIHNNK
jgi:hypothetical protein